MNKPYVSQELEYYNFNKKDLLKHINENEYFNNKPIPCSITKIRSNVDDNENVDYTIYGYTHYFDNQLKIGKRFLIHLRWRSYFYTSEIIKITHESDTTKLIETENSIYRIKLLNKEENIYETN